jgi:hypothetical protein
VGEGYRLTTELQEDVLVVPFYLCADTTSVFDQGTFHLSPSKLPFYELQVERNRIKAVLVDVTVDGLADV